MITISAAQGSEIPKIKHVLTTTWHETYRFFLPDDAIEKVISVWHSEDTLRKEIESSSTYLGVAKTEQNKPMAIITAHEDGNLLFVSRLYVLPQYQNQGIGKRLLQASNHAFQDTTLVRLDVEEQNSIGRSFYRKLGFSEIGQKSEDVFGTELQSIVMERDIVRDA